MAAICVGNFTAGTGQYLTRASLSGAPNLQASSTICVRVKHSTTSTTTATVLADFCNNGLTSAGAVFGRNNGIAATGLNTYRGGSSNQATYSTCYGNTTTWYHIAVVYNATTAMIRFYIDGAFIGQHASPTTSAANSVANSFLVGWHPGKFADAAIWNRALTDLEIADQADYRVCQVTSGLLGFWRLDSNGNDSSGNSQNFTAGGTGTAVTYSVADNPPQPETPAVALDGDAASSSAFAGTLTNFRFLAGAAASSSVFAGSLNTTKPVAGSAASSSAITGQLRALIAGAASSSSALGAWLRPRWGRRIGYLGGSSALTQSMTNITSSAPWTVMTWIRPIDLPVSTNSVTFQLSDGGAANIVTLWVRNTGGVIQSRISVTANSSLVIAYIATNDTDWHHFAVTFDGSTARAYIDGALVASGAAAPSLPLNFATIGTLSTGALAEFAHAKVWAGTALSAGEITSEATYYTPHTNNSALRAWWQLSWQSPTLDSSGNGETWTDNGSLEAQTESPGLPIAPITGDLASSSSFAGALNTTKPIAGDLATQSVFAGTVTVSLPIAGAAATTSVLSASLTALISGSAASSSAFTAILGTLKPIAGDAASSSALAGALRALISGAASSSSAFAGALTTAIPADGALASDSAFSGTLGVQGLFAGPAATASAFSGDLGLDSPIDGGLVSASAFSAALGQAYAVTGALASGTAFAGELGLRFGISGTVTTASAFGGTLTVPFDLQGDVASVSTLAGALRQTIGITGQLATGSAFSAQLTALAAGNVASASAFSAALGNSVLRALTGNPTSVSLLSGSLTTLAQRAVAGAAVSTSNFAGGLTVTVTAAASGNVVTGGAATAYYGPGTIASPRRGRPWPQRY